MACGIARGIKQLDHLALVANPEDKRCVVQFEDSAPQFKLIRYISEMIVLGKFRISDLSELQFSKRAIPNPDYRQLERNERCFCGSNRKFKKCCISKEYVEGDHMEVIAKPRAIEVFVV
jgi:hypothetical protein